MTAVDSLMLDAKQAIMDEHHRRFQTLHHEGRWEEALQQIHVTLSCASDLLNESLRVLDEALETHNHTPPTAPLPSQTPVIGSGLLSRTMGIVLIPVKFSYELDAGPIGPSSLINLSGRGSLCHLVRLVI